jgi:hypothetical protein
LDRWNLLSDFAALNASSASPCSLAKEILPWHC